MANRATRRKEKIKSDKKVVLETKDENLGSAAKVTALVIGCLVLFYIITIIATGGLKFDQGTDNEDENNTPAAIQYDEILAGETFKMQEAEYFVMFYDFDESTAALYNYLISNYESNHTNGSKIYIVDLSKGFNISYVGETSNPSVTNIDNLKVKGPTLIGIKNGLVTSYSEGKDAIKQTLK